jgi:NTP pyrophosphatase (non-canonical NTP hydrolase)
MNKALLDYIQVLSLRDKKTLSQKALKLAEEVGEVARVILPYDGAYATNHRFAEPEDILEESIDSILCALSISYHLGYTHEDIDAMMVRKSEKWSKLQANEDKAQFPLPFEIHVTVRVNDSPWTKLAVFETTCKDIGVKPIILDLQKDNQYLTTDIMTSSKHFGDNRSAFLEAQRISNGLLRGGFEIARIKIETVPWHPAAPQADGDEMPKDCYFESHFAVRVSDKNKSPLGFRLEALKFIIYRSQNPLKVHEDGSRTVMFTYRQYAGTRSHFENAVRQIHEQLNYKYDHIPHEETKVGTPITEFSIYDTKVSHDASWILGNDRTDIGPIQDS